MYCNRHSNETVTLRKHVSKTTNMRKRMIKFLREFENRGIKIAEPIPKSINLQFLNLILHGIGVRCDRRRFFVHSPFIEKSMTLKKHSNMDRESTELAHAEICLDCFPYNYRDNDIMSSPAAERSVSVSQISREISLCQSDQPRDQSQSVRSAERLV